MNARRLKNFDKYLQKLELYARAINIKIEYKEEAGDGIYIPTLRKIRIDPDLEDSTTIATFLHELGHHQDDLTENNMHKSSLHRAYENVYAEKPTVHQVKLVLECETKAWKQAELIASKLKIKLGKWFYSEKTSALKGYKDV